MDLAQFLIEKYRHHGGGCVTLRHFSYMTANQQ
jgi:hypothetical protein